ncbi:MAG: trypsin-like peptidase domain-containing protein [Prevotellaceae bacterium]|jgi:hypothetical protein|nr:trypsin-like peptidase domain-containing protein [Prevotellaceae bacterium]
MKKTVILLLILACSITGLSQVQSAFYENKDALQYHAKIKTFSSKSIPMKKMRSFDMAKLLREDKQNEEKQDVPFRFGYGFDVNYTLKDGVWEVQNDNNIWSLRVSSEGAYSINIIFEELFLSESAEMYIFSIDGSMVYGPVTNEQNISGQNFLSDIIAGDEVVIQLIEHVSSIEKSFLRISKVVHGYKNMFALLADGGNITQSLGASASCNNDIACYSSWANESNAIALVLLSSGTEWCTGSLLNNTSQNYKPYFLSAFHCIDTDQNGALSTTEKNNSQNWAFRFNYKKSTCNSNTVTNYITYNNANFRSGWVNTDFSLMELTGTPVAGLTFLGWDKTGNNPASGICIHHPSGDVMKISFENNTFSSSTWVGHHWLVNFDNGIVEHGSSGSPLFDQNKRVVGQLHGNQTYNSSISYCSQPRAEYGKFSSSWTGGGTDATRLSHWLDPTNTGASTLNTIKYPAISGASQICEASTYTLSNLPTGATVTWQIEPATNASVSGSGSSVTITPLMRGLFTLKAILSTGYTVTKNIQAGEEVALSNPIRIRHQSGNLNLVYGSTLVYGSPYYLELLPQSELINRYEWNFGSHQPSYITSNFSFPYIANGNGSLLQDDYPMNIVISARFRDCFGWYPLSVERMVTIIYENTYPYSAAYPNPASNELIIDRETNNNEITVNTTDNKQNIQAKNSATVKVLLYSHSTTQLVYSKYFPASEQQIKIDTSKLPNGIYYLNIIANNEKIKEQTIIVNH